MCDDDISAQSSIQVAVRIRPSQSEAASQNLIEIYSKSTQLILKSSDKKFRYNHIFDTNTTQHFFYNSCIKDKIENLFKGYNVTVMAYGHGAFGKTYTMGTVYPGKEDIGVIPRAIKEIFNFVKDSFCYDFTVTVSFMELCQEVCFDLLTSDPREQCTVEIKDDNAPVLTKVIVSSAVETLQYLRRGSERRGRNSRSHAFFSINICMQKRGTIDDTKTANFLLVDLAGLEGSKKTGPVEEIDKGLVALENLISTLSDEKSEIGNIIYNTSNLTRLLKDSIGGNSITLMIACISSADYNLDETSSTLQYAHLATKIKNKPVVNENSTKIEINRVNKLNQSCLKLGGLAECQAELDLSRKENNELALKIRQLNVKLSTTITDNTILFETIFSLQSGNEELIKKLQALEREYNTTLNDLDISVAKSVVKGIKENFHKLRNMQTCLADLNSQVQYVDKIRKHKAHTTNYDCNFELADRDRQEEFNTQQMALINELFEVTYVLVMKESLLQEIRTNYSSYSVDCDTITEMKNEMATLENEKDNLLQQLEAKCSNKIRERRNKHLQQVEGEIHILRIKIMEQDRLLKMKNDDNLQMEQLNNEITVLTKKKVELFTTMRAESDKFRNWILARKRGLELVGVHDRKRKKLETVHTPQNLLNCKSELLEVDVNSDIINGGSDDPQLRNVQMPIYSDEDQNGGYKNLSEMQQEITDLTQKLDKLEKENETLKSDARKLQNKENIGPLPQEFDRYTGIPQVDKNATLQLVETNVLTRRGCSCKGTCSSRNCGCQKTKKSCSTLCKCKQATCTNRERKSN